MCVGRGGTLGEMIKHHIFIPNKDLRGSLGFVPTGGLMVLRFLNQFFKCYLLLPAGSVWDEKVGRIVASKFNFACFRDIL